MEFETTFTFLKPDGLERAAEILNYQDCMLGLTGKFERTPGFFLRNVPREVFRKHYKNLFDRGFGDIAEKMADYLSERAIIASFYSGEGIIGRFREVLGDTDPVKAKVKNPNSVRAKFSNDSLEIARLEKRPVRNVEHASGNPEDFRIEGELWIPYLRQACDFQILF